MSPSSPITYPSSPVSQGTKRPRQDDTLANDTAPPVLGGFVLDEDSDEGCEVPQPLTKKRMIEPPAEDTSNSSSLAASGLFDSGSALGISNSSVTPLTQLDLSVFQTQSSTRLDPEPTRTSQVVSSSSFFPTETRSYKFKTCDGKTSAINFRKKSAPVSYETLVAARSKTKEGRAKRAYYGIEIHELTRLASLELQQRQDTERETSAVSTQPAPATTNITGKRSKKGMLWSEKYRARKFTDLCGDDGTNRLVLRWIKRWDPMVFPGLAKPKPKQKPFDQPNGNIEKPHRKILLLTGPPGLGKTTLAHVCARQAGYEVVEVNASDDRSKNVVNNRIRTCLGTENVKTVANNSRAGGPQKPARPVCVVVDEVDGVTTGSGPSGEGGFIKALIDLVLLDQKNAASTADTEAAATTRRKKRTDDFRQRRPLILICNDLYHPSLRPLRQSNLAEIIHVGKPSLDAVIGRLSLVFEKEGIPCEKDAARKLCEAAWGMPNATDMRRGAESTVQGDLRGVMVVGEWVAGRFRAAPERPGLLTRNWVEEHIMPDLANGGAGARGMGRGGTKDIVTRVFQEGAGFPHQALVVNHEAKLRREQPKAQLGFSEFHKRNGMAKLEHMIQTSGDADRILMDVISEYPNHDFNDDCYLTKPNEAYDWLHFLDTCSTRLFSGQEWELAPYLSQPILACHSLFAAPIRHHGAAYGAGADAEEGPQSRFAGPRAGYVAHEAEKHSRSVLQAMQAEFSPTLGRLFRSPEDLATEFVPYLVPLVSPAVNPVVVGGGGRGISMASVRKESEKRMVLRAAEVMLEVGITLQKGKLEGEVMPGRGPEWVYRMEPDLDELADYETLSRTSLTSGVPTRYAVRQVLDQELHKVTVAREEAARQARFQAGHQPGQNAAVPAARATAAPRSGPTGDKENLVPGEEKAAAATVRVRKDFFGRIIKETEPLRERDANKGGGSTALGGQGKVKVWVKYNEGLNNAVRRPITLKDFMKIL